LHLVGCNLELKAHCILVHLSKKVQTWSSKKWQILKATQS